MGKSSRGKERSREEEQQRIRAAEGKSSKVGRAVAARDSKEKRVF